MTQTEAKAIYLEMWRYLAEHPEISDKTYLPEHIFEKIAYFNGWCPLCELFRDGRKFCPGCPLSGENYFCYTKGQPFYRWHIARSKKDREAAAKDMWHLGEAWEVGE